MGECCGPDGYDQMFSTRFARRMARRYRKHGLSRSATALTGFLTERGLDGAAVLEIGGGVGQVQVERLLAAAGSKAGRMLVFSHPPRNVVTRVVLWLDNSIRRVKGDSFRSIAHPPERMLATLGDAGLRATYRWRGFGWCVVGLER